jgi:hypothetical protein
MGRISLTDTLNSKFRGTLYGLGQVLNGIPLRAAIMEDLANQNNPLLGFPFMKWIQDPDDKVIGQRFSPVCYVEDTVPAVIYLALKYHQNPEKALIANTAIGH